VLEDITKQEKQKLSIHLLKNAFPMKLRHISNVMREVGIVLWQREWRSGSQKMKRKKRKTEIFSLIREDKRKGEA